MFHMFVATTARFSCKQLKIIGLCNYPWLGVLVVVVVVCLCVFMCVCVCVWVEIEGGWSEKKGFGIRCVCRSLSLKMSNATFDAQLKIVNYLQHNTESCLWRFCTELQFQIAMFFFFNLLKLKGV